MPCESGGIHPYTILCAFAITVLLPPANRCANLICGSYEVDSAPRRASEGKQDSTVECWRSTSSSLMIMTWVEAHSANAFALYHFRTTSAIRIGMNRLFSRAPRISKASPYTMPAEALSNLLDYTSDIIQITYNHSIRSYNYGGASLDLSLLFQPSGIRSCPIGKQRDELAHHYLQQIVYLQSIGRSATTETQTHSLRDAKFTVWFP